MHLCVLSLALALWKLLRPPFAASSACNVYLYSQHRLLGTYLHCRILVYYKQLLRKVYSKRN